MNADIRNPLDIMKALKGTVNVVEPRAKANDKRRRFYGSWRGGYGPVFDPSMANVMSSDVGGAGLASQPAGSVGPAFGGDGGASGAIVSSVGNNKFKSFIESIRNEETNALCESIVSAYDLLFESKEKRVYEVNSKHGGKKIKTKIPPSKRTYGNLPRYSTGESRVRFQDWLEMTELKHATGKGCDGKWYGWSHRAIHGFKAGDKVKKGDIIYKNKEYEIKTEADAKKAAKEFASCVA